MYCTLRHLNNFPSSDHCAILLQEESEEETMHAFEAPQPWNLHDDTFLFEIRDDDRHCTVCGIIIEAELGVEGYGTPLYI